jgi:hypothetical protein
MASALDACRFGAEASAVVGDGARRIGDELALSARIETGVSGFLAGVEHASRYAGPNTLRGLRDCTYA